MPATAAHKLSQHTDAALRLGAAADLPAQQTYVTVKHSGCILSLWPQKLLRINGSDGRYLIPFESEGLAVPVFEEHYLVTYQIIPADDRFIEPGAVYCLGVPGDYESGNAVRILAMQRVAGYEGLD